jgi:hypothetical protein
VTIHWRSASQNPSASCAAGRGRDEEKEPWQMWSGTRKRISLIRL